LRPAETTEGWRDLVSRGDGGEELSQAFTGFSCIEAAEPGEEAKVIALILRHVLEEPQKSAALVTPDRALARRVVSWLTRWNIDIDDSAGVPLDQTPPASFLRAILDCLEGEFEPVKLLALLKHPLTHIGFSRPELRSKAAQLEIACLRGPRPAPGLEGLKAAVAQSKEVDHLEPLVAALEEAFQSLVAEVIDQEAWSHRIQAHIRVAEALSSDHEATGAQRLWSGEAGEAASLLINELLSVADHLHFARGQDYGPILSQLMASRVVRPHFGTHPRLFIWGPLEARLQTADVVVLGGLNEKTWPAEVRLDPWLSRPMAAQLGLSSPERRIGLAAHDFAQLAAGAQVYVTRSVKQDGAPTVPSRWLMRLENMLKGLGAGELLESETPYLDWARALDRPSAFLPVEEPRPTPPVEVRPRELSVTSVETWIRDPYGLYARKILNLDPLEPLDADASALERGIIIHEALERFIDAYPETLPPHALDELLSIGRQTFARHASTPDVERFWWPRFEAVAEWFVDREHERRPATVPLKWEVAGQLVLEASGGDFKLTARADRFDKVHDGTIGLYDYKTGRAPTGPQVKSGLAPQLPLEALIAIEGGFKGLGKVTISDIAYLELKGNDPAGVEKTVRADVGDLIARAKQGLLDRIALFDMSTTPYRSRVRPMFVAIPGPYDHLARVKEWSVYGTSEGGAND
jgi:ATP-dependent helicase/nuclease subunit B